MAKKSAVILLLLNSSQNDIMFLQYRIHNNPSQFIVHIHFPGIPSRISNRMNIKY